MAFTYVKRIYLLYIMHDPYVNVENIFEFYWALIRYSLENLSDVLETQEHLNLNESSLTMEKEYGSCLNTLTSIKKVMNYLLISEESCSSKFLLKFFEQIRS